MIIDVLLLIAMPCFIDAPSTPVFDVISSKNENECAVFVQWLREPPSSDCPILFHTISYRRQGKSGWKRLNITETDTNREKLETECSTEYEFQLVAWNEVGSSPFTTKTYKTKGTARKTNERGIYNANGSHCIGRFHMTSRQPY